MEEQPGEGPDYPTTLDVVTINGQEVQIVAQAHDPQDPGEDIYLVKDTETGQFSRIVGASFERTSTAEPGEGEVYLREEGVRVTGALKGGEKEAVEAPKK